MDRSHWIEIFHSLIIPFLGGFALTLLKSVADQRLLSWEHSNDIALDMVLIGVGALGAFYIRGGTVNATIDAGVGDAFLAAILLYLRYQRNHWHSAAFRSGPKSTGLFRAIAQLVLGAGSIIWTIKAF